MGEDDSVVASIPELAPMEAGPSGLQKAKEREPSKQVNGDGVVGEGDDGDADSDEDDEYNVEDIRAKRVNPKTGILEYLIKWENYPEAANTWEPSHHVNCPDLILKFESKQDKKRKRRRTATDSQIKRSKNEKPEQTLLVEDDQPNPNSSSKAPSSSSNGISTDPTSKDLTQNDKNSTPTATPKPKGFERALPIERILGSCTDDNDKIWFFVKWVGMSELELVEASEMEDKAPKEMCIWYRQRLYHTLKPESSDTKQQQQQQQPNGLVQMRAN